MALELMPVSGCTCKEGCQFFNQLNNGFIQFYHQFCLFDTVTRAKLYKKDVSISIKGKCRILRAILA